MSGGAFMLYLGLGVALGLLIFVGLVGLALVAQIARDRYEDWRWRR